LLVAVAYVGMARAMGATLMGTQKLLGKIKICDFQFLQTLFCAPYVND